jgi:hypothetical protein
MTVGLLISTTNLSSSTEKDIAAKQITGNIMEFLVDQTKYMMEITPTDPPDPPLPSASVSDTNYTIPTSDKIYNGKWPNPNPWTPGSSTVSVDGIDAGSSDYDDLTYDEKKTFFNALTVDEKKEISNASYKNNLIFYVGDADGVPANKGYLYFKRADDGGTAINVYGKAFYGNKNRKISIDVSEIQDPFTSKIVVTITVNLWEGEGASSKIKTSKNSFELVNIDADADEDKFDDWDDDITIIGADDPPRYYIGKDVKYFDW